MSVPVRTCIVTRQRHNKFDMVRIVYFNDFVKVDSTFNENGRGVYLLPDLKVFDEGVLKHKIENGLKLGRSLDKVEVLRLRQEFEDAVALRDKEALEEHKEKLEETNSASPEEGTIGQKETSD